MSTPIAALVDRGARLLGDYVQSGRTRKDLLKEVAEVIVDLRYRHTLDDGRVDLSGRSKEYRAEVQEMYRRAHVPPDRYDTVQAALRYHVGNLLRERASAEDLAAVGLTSVSPKARISRTRDVVAAMSKSGSVAELTSDPLRLISYAEALASHVEPHRLDDLKGKERVAARLALEALRDVVSTLLPRVAAATGGRGRGRLHA